MRPAEQETKEQDDGCYQRAWGFEGVIALLCCCVISLWRLAGRTDATSFFLLYGRMTATNTGAEKSISYQA